MYRTFETDQTQSLLNGQSRPQKHQNHFGLRVLFLIAVLTFGVLIYSRHSSNDEEGLGTGLHAQLDDASQSSISDESDVSAVQNTINIQKIVQLVLAGMPSLTTTISPSAYYHVCEVIDDQSLKYITGNATSSRKKLKKALDSISTSALETEFQQKFQKELEDGCCATCAEKFLYNNPSVKVGAKDKLFCDAFRSAADDAAKIKLQAQVYGCPTKKVCSGIAKVCSPASPRVCPPGYFSPTEGLLWLNGTKVTATEWEKIRPDYMKDKPFDEFTISSNDACFKYIFRIPGLPFRNARAFCHSEGGDLATFASVGELHYAMAQTFLKHERTEKTHTIMKPMVGYILKNGKLLGLDGKYMESSDAETWKWSTITSFGGSGLSPQTVKDAFKTNAATKSSQDVIVLRVQSAHKNLFAADRHTGLVYKAPPTGNIIVRKVKSWINTSGAPKRRDSPRGFLCRVSSQGYIDRRDMTFPKTGLAKMCEAHEDNIREYSKCMHYANDYVDIGFHQKLYSISRLEWKSKNELSANCCKAPGDAQKCPWGRGIYDDTTNEWKPKQFKNNWWFGRKTDGTYCHAAGLKADDDCKTKAIARTVDLSIQGVLAAIGIALSFIDGGIVTPIVSLVSTAGGLIYDNVRSEPSGQIVTGLEQDYCFNIKDANGFWPAISPDAKTLLSCEVSMRYFGFFQASTHMLRESGDLWTKNENIEMGSDLIKEAIENSDKVGTVAGIANDAAKLGGELAKGIKSFTEIVDKGTGFSGPLGVATGAWSLGLIVYEFATWKNEECQQARPFDQTTAVIQDLQNYASSATTCDVKFFIDDKFTGPAKRMKVEPTPAWKELSSVYAADKLVSFRVIGSKCVLTICKTNDASASPPSPTWAHCMSFKRGNWQLPVDYSGSGSDKMNLGQELKFQKPLKTGKGQMVKKKCAANSGQLGAESFCWPTSIADAQLEKASDIFQLEAAGVGDKFIFKMELEP